MIFQVFEREGVGAWAMNMGSAENKEETGGSSAGACLWRGLQDPSTVAAAVADRFFHPKLGLQSRSRRPPWMQSIQILWRHPPLRVNLPIR